MPGKIKPIDSRAESLIVKGKAVHVSGKKNDGVLYLTNFNLVFESKSREYLKIKLQDIIDVRIVRTFGLWREGIIINRKNQRQDKFKLKYPGDWKDIINYFTSEN